MHGCIPNIWHDLKAYRRFLKLDPKDREIVFYAEGETYWRYMGPVLERLAGDYGRDVCYITSSPSDPRLNLSAPQFRSFLIRAGSIRTIFFAALNSKVLVMSMPGLGATYIRRSKYPVHYVFVPHAMVSTHMVFPKGSYDHFDTVFCVGPHHRAELEEAKVIYDRAAPELVDGGYVWLDTLMDEAAAGPVPGPQHQIMIAPTWGASSLLSHDIETLVHSLLEGGNRVVFRPHRDSLIDEKAAVDRVIQQFGNNPAFVHGAAAARPDIMLKTHVLVTDWSGSAFSFAFGFERPVLFVDTPPKINNVDFQRYASVPVEISLRNEIGAVIGPDELARASHVVEDLMSRRAAIAEKIRRVRPRHVYRMGESADFTARYINDLIAGMEPQDR